MTLLNKMIKALLGLMVLVMMVGFAETAEAAGKGNGRGYGQGAGIRQGLGPGNGLGNGSGICQYPDCQNACQYPECLNPNCPRLTSPPATDKPAAPAQTAPTVSSIQKNGAKRGIGQGINQRSRDLSCL